MSGGRTRWTKPVQHQQLARRPNNPTPVLSVMAPIGESKNPIKGGKNEKKKFGISQVFHHHGRQFHHESKEPTNRQRHTGNSLFVCSDFSLVLCFSSTFLVGFRAKVFPYIYLFCIAFGQQNDGWVSYWSIQATQSAFMGHTQNPQEQSLPREKGELAPLSKVERRGKTPAPCVARVLINIPSRPLKLFLIFLLLRQRPGKVISNGQQRKQNIARPVCREAVGASERYDGGRKRERGGRKEKKKKLSAVFYWSDGGEARALGALESFGSAATPLLRAYTQTIPSSLSFPPILYTYIYIYTMWHVICVDPRRRSFNSGGIFRHPISEAQSLLLL